MKTLTIDDKINVKNYFTNMGLKSLNKSVETFLIDLKIKLDTDDYNDRIDYYLEKYYFR